MLRLTSYERDPVSCGWSTYAPSTSLWRAQKLLEVPQTKFTCFLVTWENVETPFSVMLTQ